MIALYIRYVYVTNTFPSSLEFVWWEGGLFLTLMCLTFVIQGVFRSRWTHMLGYGELRVLGYNRFFSIRHISLFPFVIAFLYGAVWSHTPSVYIQTYKTMSFYDRLQVIIGLFVMHILCACLSLLCIIFFQNLFNPGQSLAPSQLFSSSLYVLFYVHALLQMTSAVLSICIFIYRQMYELFSSCLSSYISQRYWKLRIILLGWGKIFCIICIVLIGILFAIGLYTNTYTIGHGDFLSGVYSLIALLVDFLYGIIRHIFLG